MTNIKILALFAPLLILLMLGVRYGNNINNGAPPYEASTEDEASTIYGPLAWMHHWQRPDIPVRVGVQVGHWHYDKVPEELKRLRNNSGAEANGVRELDINFTVASLLMQKLQAQGIKVDLLPATIPPAYFADVFIAIHADGSDDSSTSGYKFATPWRDQTGNAEKLLQALEHSYETVSELEKDPNITRNMRGYYAFSWWRFRHALHPMTTAVIAEIGFVTNEQDRIFLTNSPNLIAQALADGILINLHQRDLL